MKKHTLVSALLLAVLAQPALAEDEGQTEMSPPVQALHDVLSPLMQAEKGEQRTADTCAEIETLRSLSQEIFLDEVRDFENALDDLDVQCGIEGGTFEQAFVSVQSAFHRIVEADKL